jgi:hypothetical protein
LQRGLSWRRRDWLARERRTTLLRYSPFVSQVLAERSQLEEARLASQREENYLDRLAQATKQASHIFSNYVCFHYDPLELLFFKTKSYDSAELPWM